MMRDNDFLCPSCKGHLNAGGYVIFNTRNPRKQRGLILLSPKVGSYTHKRHDSYHFVDGDIIDFYCPICGVDLSSKTNEHYASLTMIDHNNQEYDVMFSRKAGEQSTVVSCNENIELFGADAHTLDDLFDEDL